MEEAWYQPWLTFCCFLVPQIDEANDGISELSEKQSNSCSLWAQGNAHADTESNRHILVGFLSPWFARGDTSASNSLEAIIP